jgi:hypothetical protein
MRRGCLTAALLGIAILLGAAYLFGTTRSEYAVYSAVAVGGASLSKSARMAADEACAQSALKNNLTNVDLRLKPPHSISNKYVQSVTVSSSDSASVLVSIIYNEIEQVVPEGKSLVYRGECHQKKMTWSLSGTVPEKFWPRM